MNEHDVLTTLHAGGEYLLLEFRGMDATVPFESFHPFTDRHRKALARMKPVGTRDSLPPGLL
jgi:cytochrome b involved in lipid metabolism